MTNSGKSSKAFLDGESGNQEIEFFEQSRNLQEIKHLKEIEQIFR